MFIFGKYDGPCPKECPRRAPDCHNAKTCENWARHEAKQEEKRRRAQERYAARRMSWEERSAKDAR